MPETDALHGVKVGDTLYELGRSWGTRPDKAHPVIVVKVARKLITVVPAGHPASSLSASQFRIDTGEWNDKNYGYQVHVVTAEKHAEIKHRADLERRLYATKLMEIRLGYGLKLSTAKLERIVEILEEDEA